jgi:hypothetical protein
MFEGSGERAEQAAFGFRVEGFAAFAIDADDVLMAGDDASLDRGDALGVGQDAFMGDTGIGKALAQRGGGVVAALSSFFRTGDAEQFDASAKGGEVGGNVSGAAEAFGLIDEIDDGNGGFGRQARSGAPKVAVQHQVANDADVTTAEAGDQAFQLCDGIRG